MIVDIEKKITIWSFENAPKEYQELSTHGGDEDWVLYCPKDTNELYMPSGLNDALDGNCDHVTGFGWCDQHKLEDGAIVLIFAHA